MTKTEFTNKYNKIIFILGEDTVLDELDENYETTEIDDLTKVEREEFLNYIIEEHMLEAELTDLDEIDYTIDLDD